MSAKRKDLIKLRRIIRRAAALAGAAALSIMGLVGFYGMTLPDFYYLADGRELAVDSVFSVTSGYGRGAFEEDLTVSGSYPGTRSITERTLMLFGSIPIKSVTAAQIERPLVVPGGEPFGIKLMTDGVMVIGLEDIGSACPASECGIEVGDVIMSIDGETVTTNRRVSEIISQTRGKPCSVEFSRSGSQHTVTLVPVYSGGTYKAGMWVRDSSAGIGTLTFYDPVTKAFGGLGHPICDADTKQPMPISHGTVGEVNITGCIKSERGEPGQLSGEFASQEVLGSIKLNIAEGVFGTLEGFPINGQAIPLGFKQEIRKGEAEILSTLKGGAPKRYSVVIESIDMSESALHDMVVKVTDPELIAEAGGIVQGMSGSPIIQDGRLVGAVTHVFVDDPTHGYAIFADDMYSNVMG